MTEQDLQRAAEFIRTQVRAPLGSTEYAGRSRFLSALDQRKPRLARRALMVAVASCAVIVGVALTSHYRRGQVLTYRIGTSTDAGEIGSYVSAPAAARLDLNFSEGSRVVLEPRARGRVARATRHGATMILEDGRASVDIVHRPHTDWRILAGPYVVQVAGTSFEVSYDVSTQTFELDMREGVVRVTGPGLAVPGEIRGTQRIQLSPGGTREPLPADSAGSAPAAAGENGETNESEPQTPSSAPSAFTTEAPLRPASSAGLERRKAPQSWSELGARAEHQKIVDYAEKRGLDRALGTASRPDLFALANAARFSGKHRLAARAYSAIRNRFSGSSEATSAAFFLGRLNEASDPATAIGWYERYAHEAPGGPWVAEALGRRMVLLNASGAEAARAAAQDYLRRFATGPYAGFAQKILQP